jgi:hypothetical protein
MGQRRIGQASLADGLLPTGVGSNRRRESIAGLIDWAPLAVVAKDVVPGDAADWGFSSESGVRSRAVVAVEPGGHGERPLG